MQISLQEENISPSRVTMESIYISEKAYVSNDPGLKEPQLICSKRIKSKSRNAAASIQELSSLINLTGTAGLGELFCRVNRSLGSAHS